MKSILTRMVLLIIILMVFHPAQLIANDGESRGSERTEVEAVALGIIAADNQGDLEQVLRFYAEDAILIPPGEEPVRGLDSIRPRYVALFEAFDPEIESSIEEIVVQDDLAFVRGHNGGVLRSLGDADDRNLNDVYLMILRKRDGEWRITRLMWHSAGRH